jgi:DNA-binding NtrC family response regulator
MAMILIVEDDAFIRELAEMTIHDLDYEFVSATDVDEALVILRSDRRIDALFTDIYLKKRIHGGCEIADVTAVLRPECRILYTTGNTMSAEMFASFTKGSEFLPKPYTTTQLEVSIRHLLAA